MPKTKKFGGKTYRFSRSFKLESKADDYAESCRRRGFNARVTSQSGPRITNPWAVYVRSK